MIKGNKSDRFILSRSSERDLKINRYNVKNSTYSSPFVKSGSISSKYEHRNSSSLTMKTISPFLHNRQKIIKSIVLKTPNINVPDFEFAGIKYEFTIYHTPFYYFNCSLDNSLPTATVAFIAAFSFSPTTSSIELYVDSAADNDAAVLATNLS